MRSPLSLKFLQRAGDSSNNKSRSSDPSRWGTCMEGHQQTKITQLLAPETHPISRYFKALLMCDLCDSDIHHYPHLNIINFFYQATRIVSKPCKEGFKKNNSLASLTFVCSGQQQVRWWIFLFFPLRSLGQPPDLLLKQKPVSSHTRRTEGKQKQTNSFVFTSSKTFPHTSHCA